MPIINMVYKKKKGWKPWTNTLAYWELNWNADDTKNNYWVQTYTTTNFNSDGYVWAWNPTYTEWRKWKQCAVFDWTRGLQFPSTLNSYKTNTVTFSAWVNYTSASAGNFGTWSSIFQLNSDNQQNPSSRCVFFRIKSNWICAPMAICTSVPSGETWQIVYELTWASLSTWVWHNVVFTFNAGVIKFYIDKVLIETKTTSNLPYLRNTTPASPSFIWVTKEYSWGDYYSYLTWKIQDVIYENKVWTDQEVVDYYDTN